MSIDNQGNYVVMVNSVKSAIKLSSDVDNKWVKAGDEVFAYFKTEKALAEVKAQFCADTIIPAIDKKHGEALAKDLPKLNSKAYVELVSKDNSYPQKWEIAYQAKKDARATVATMYNRIKGYAFPADKKDKVVKSFADKIKALIEDGGKLKEADFDLVKVMGFLTQAYNATQK